MAVSIRRWNEQDKNNLAYYANNEKISGCLRNTFPYPYTEEDAEFFIRLARHVHSEREWILAIDVNREAVGGISLDFGEDVHSRTAELGYWVGEPHWSKGIATEAVNQICQLAFETTDIVRIQAEVFSNNPASIQVLQKNRFIQEGYFCNRIFKNDRLLDSVLFATFR